MAKIFKNTEMEIVTPQPATFIRTITLALSKQLREEDQATLEAPTLLSRAKSLVNKKSFIVLLTTKEDV